MLRRALWRGDAVFSLQDTMKTDTQTTATPKQTSRSTNAVGASAEAGALGNCLLFSTSELVEGVNDWILSSNDRVSRLLSADAGKLSCHAMLAKLAKNLFKRNAKLHRNLSVKSCGKSNYTLTSFCNNLLRFFENFS